MSRSATILRNIASNWAGFAINAVITLILTPFVLRELGDARYGVWVLTLSIIGYYGFLDLGLRGSVNQYLTRYLALDDYGKANECISTAVATLSALGALLWGLSIGAAYLAPRIFDLPTGMENEVFWCLLIVGFASAVQFAFFSFGAVFTATQRFDLANLIGAMSRVLMAGSIYVVLSAGFGLIGISIVTCGANLIDYLIRWRVAYQLAPRLEVSWRGINLARLREMGSFGFWNFLISVSTYIFLHADALVIGLFMPIVAVTHFALAANLWRQINDVLTPVGQVMFPIATELHARRERGGLERLYCDGSRLMMLATICIVLIASFWAEDFYRLWVGEKYLSGTPFPSVASLLQVFLIGTVALYTTNIGGQILLGAGRVRLLAVSVICEAGLNLVLSLILIRFYGLVGVAASSVFALVLVRLIVIPLILQRYQGLHIKNLLYGVCRPLAVGVLLAALIVCIRHISQQTEDWLHLILQGILAGTSAVIVVLAVGVTTEERQRFLVHPLWRLLKKEMSTAEIRTR